MSAEMTRQELLAEVARLTKENQELRTYLKNSLEYVSYAYSQGIQGAEELGRKIESLPLIGEVTLTDEELTALCNAVRKQTLLEASDHIARTSEKDYGVALLEHIEVAVELRRMADEC